MTAPALLLALDVPDAASALASVDRLDGRCSFVKVGLELFVAEGPSIVRALRARGVEVFLDLKLHDIPNTVRAAAARAAALDVRLLTVHASGGRRMLEAAVNGAGAETGVLGVSVLTSMDASQLAAAWGRPTVDVRFEVLRLASDCAAVGAHGLVCSGEELGAVVAAHGERLRPLVPGVRMPGDSANDQSRIVTPADAMVGGAAYLILGRTITAATDPVAKWDAIVSSLHPAAGPA
jgi:orotidine-5'-phosphate decarboxylase